MTYILRLLCIIASIYQCIGCGNIPSSCAGEISWAVREGISSHPEWYPNFQSVTGTALSSASEEDIVTFWVCTQANPNNNCNGLELPCSRSCSPSGGDDSSAFRVVTMNLFWWRLFGELHGLNFFSVFGASGPYDLYFFQECDDVNHIKNGLGVDITTYQPAHAVAMAWSNTRFTLIEKGWEDVAEDRYDQYFGTRCIVWARLRDTVSGNVVFAASHHGPLPVDTGGKTGGAAVASRINAVISSNMQSGDAVILGGDFNAHDWFDTVEKLQSTYNFNLRASDWVDHIFTKGNGLDATPSIKIIRDTGSDHRGVKLTWSNGISDPVPTSSTTPAPINCGNVPSSCTNDVAWALSTGRYSNPEYYTNFEGVTGTALSSASEEDMLLFWYCTNNDVNGECAGLEIPCDRSCLATSGTPINHFFGDINGRDALLVFCIFSAALCSLLVGIFIGRNWDSYSVPAHAQKIAY